MAQKEYGYNPEKFREQAYWAKGWRLHNYIYPAGAKLYGMGNEVYEIGGRGFESVRAQINRHSRYRPQDTIYIQLPSKVNTEAGRFQ